MFSGLVRKLLYSLCLYLCLTTSNVLAAPPQSLSQRLSGITSLKARFVQRVYSPQNVLLQSASGYLEVKKPNMFRWQIEEPDVNLIVSDGLKLWNYDQGLEQVVVQKYNENTESTPLNILFGDPSDLPNKFNIQINKNACYKLTPKQESAMMQSMQLCFAQNKLKNLTLLDSLGQKTVYEFNQLQNNPQLADDRFTFTPPKGVDVIDE